MNCLCCDDTGWVCENHPDQPFTGPHCNLPGGAERVEALKQAGRLRFEADRKRWAKSAQANRQCRRTNSGTFGRFTPAGADLFT
jgi:hypothetical protein